MGIFAEGDTNWSGNGFFFSLPSPPQLTDVMGNNTIADGSAQGAEVGCTSALMDKFVFARTTSVDGGGPARGLEEKRAAKRGDLEYIMRVVT